MYGKIQISGNIELITGMHIGGSSAFAAIGAVDSPVVRDIRTNLPMIPGSSFKGKMRSLLAKEYNTELAPKPDDDCERITRLFGSAKKNAIKRSRILVSDMLMINEEELRKKGIQSITEVKFENSINRATAVANPRQIERAIRGSQFEMDIMYEAEQEDEILDDFRMIGEGFKLMQYDYLGGSGSRGYGKIRFDDIAADCVIGEIKQELIDECNTIINNAING